MVLKQKTSEELPQIGGSYGDMKTKGTVGLRLDLEPKKYITEKSSGSQIRSVVYSIVSCQQYNSTIAL